MWVVDVGVLIVDVQINDAIAVAVEELVGGGESLQREDVHPHRKRERGGESAFKTVVEQGRSLDS